MSNLQALHLAKSYKHRHVVEDVSVTIEPGQVVGLLGPNGAGKTTCFYMIIGLIPADQGKILIDGQDITSLPMHGRARKGIGYLPQESSIFRKLTVSQNILAILETRKDLNREQQREKLEQLLQEFHITHIRDSSLPLKTRAKEGREMQVDLTQGLFEFQITSRRLDSLSSKM